MRHRIDCKIAARPLDLELASCVRKTDTKIDGANHEMLSHHKVTDQNGMRALSKSFTPPIYLISDLIDMVNFPLLARNMPAF
jgi:hypothetical protein